MLSWRLRQLPRRPQRPRGRRWGACAPQASPAPAPLPARPAACLPACLPRCLALAAAVLACWLHSSPQLYRQRPACHPTCLVCPAGAVLEDTAAAAAARASQAKGSAAQTAADMRCPAALLPACLPLLSLCLLLVLTDSLWVPHMHAGTPATCACILSTPHMPACLPAWLSALPAAPLPGASPPMQASS